MILTARQEQIVRLLAEGLTYKQVALRLGVMPSTIRTLIHQALRNNDCNGRSAQLVVDYICTQMVSPAAVDAAIRALRASEGKSPERMRSALEAAVAVARIDTRATGAGLAM